MLSQSPDGELVNFSVSPMVWRGAMKEVRGIPEGVLGMIPISLCFTIIPTGCDVLSTVSRGHHTSYLVSISWHYLGSFTFFDH